MRTLPRLLAGLAVCLLGGAALVAFRDAPRVRTEGSLYVVEQGGWRYTFHGVYGRETLVRMTSDGVERLPAEPDEAARLRSLLLRQTGVETLDDLKSRHTDEAEQLRFLGYL